MKFNYDQLLECFDSTNLIFEVSRFRQNDLKNIEEIFDKLKKDPKSKDIKFELCRKIEKFSGIDRIFFSIKSDTFNAMVIAAYKFTDSFVKDFFNFIVDETKNKELMAKEASKGISKAYIIFGDKFIEELSAKELTAILLHELGHVYSHTSLFPFYLQRVFKLFIGVGLIKIVLTSIFAMTGISIIISIIMFLTSRTLTFLEHRSEYNSDNFAAKYGYGDEMIKVLNKLRKYEISEERKKIFLIKFVEFIEELFFPSQHPESKDRICDISNKMINDYKKLYPKFNKELTIILNDLKC